MLGRGSPSKSGNARVRNPRVLLWEDQQKWKVSDSLGFAKDTINELCREEEDGTTPLDELFDKVMTEAADQGSLSIKEVTDHKSAYARDYEKEQGVL